MAEGFTGLGVQAECSVISNPVFNERRPIPKGLRLKAQRCAARAALGQPTEYPKAQRGFVSTDVMPDSRNPVGVVVFRALYPG